MSTKESAINRIKDHVPEGEHVCVAIWREDDVMTRAYGRGIEISREEARDIIDDISQHQSAEIGINWNVIDVYVDVYIVNKRGAAKI